MSKSYEAACNAIEAIIAERKRQNDKWGEQNHDAGTWALILLEEIGEWAKAELHKRFGGPDAGNDKTEIIHSAAVAMQILEWKYRTDPPRKDDGHEITDEEGGGVR